LRKNGHTLASKTNGESITGKETKLKKLESGEQVMETELVIKTGPDDVTKTIDMQNL